MTPLSWRYPQCMRLIGVLLAAILLAGCASTPTATPTDRTAAFLTVMRSVPGLENSRAGDLVRVGQTNCTTIDAARKVDPATAWDIASGPILDAGFTSAQAALILAASIAAFCTDARNLIPAEYRG